MADISSGKKNSFPSFLYVYNSQLLFNANNGDNTSGKTDLYKINVTLSPLPEALLASDLLTVEESSDLKVWPNPANKQLNISFSGTNTYTTLRVIDNSGKVVLQQSLTGNGSNSKSISLQTLTSGIYYLQLVSEKQSKTIPFVKE